MKKLIVILTVLLCSYSAFSQTTYKVVGKTLVAEKTSTTINETKTDLTTTIKDVVYPVYITKSGKYYIKRVSAKTNKEYKQYLKTN